MELFVILMSLMMAVSSTKPALSISVKSKLNSRIVQTRYGKIQGLTRTFNNSKYLQSIDVYLGIPYATPPILSNRFSPTRAPSPWDGIKLTDSVSHVCPQKLPDIANEQKALERMPKGRYEYLKRLLPYLQNQSEDCLYLNIYGPAMDEVPTALRRLLRVSGSVDIPVKMENISGSDISGEFIVADQDRVARVVKQTHAMAYLSFVHL